MNRLKREKQAQAIRCLAEGCSVRATERLTGIHRDTILRLMVRVGAAIQEHSDGLMRNLTCERVQVDEQWTFVGKKQRRLTADDDKSRMGDFWIWSAICADTRLVPTHRLGKRKAADARAFIVDLASRLQNRVQLSSDALSTYVEAVEAGFGGAVDYGQIVKSFEGEPVGAGRYAPPRVTGVEKAAIVGNPAQEHISTSYVERLHLTNRMRVRRLTRLTDAFSRKLENLAEAIHVHYGVYNFAKRHRSLDGLTPAMAAGVTDRLWSVEDLVALADW